MATITKESVLGDVALDLILKGERIMAGGHPQAGKALFDFAAKVVEKPQTKRPEPKAAPSGSPTLLR